MSKTPKREIIKAAILEGGKTKEDLMEIAEVNAAGLASQFSYLRLTGFFPIVLEDGTYGYTDKEGWEKIQAEKAAVRKTAKPRDPKARFCAAQKRLARTATVLEKAMNRLEKDPESEELQLRKDKAAIEHRLAEIEFEKAQDVAEAAGYDVSDESLCVETSNETPGSAELEEM